MGLKKRRTPEPGTQSPKQKQTSREQMQRMVFTLGGVRTWTGLRE
jgi:hypothetical protein